MSVAEKTGLYAIFAETVSRMKKNLSNTREDMLSQIDLTNVLTALRVFLQNTDLEDTFNLIPARDHLSVNTVQLVSY